MVSLNKRDACESSEPSLGSVLRYKRKLKLRPICDARPLVSGMVLMQSHSWIHVWVVVWNPLFLDPLFGFDGVSGRFDLAALACGCHTLNVCSFVLLVGATPFLIVVS